MWTRFMDMHSGGSQKEAFDYCYIEAPEGEAKKIFYNRFGHNPERVTCTCCGNDYSISEAPTLEEASAYYRNCAYEDGKWVEKPDCRYSAEKLIPLSEYVKQPEVLVIYMADIKPEERSGEVPEQGYVWV